MGTKNTFGSDNGFKNFIGVYETYKDDISSFNEADTRAKVIDAILKDCLGWPEDSIRRETHNKVGYTDYQLYINNVCYLVIEAKRADEYFEIPVSMSGRNYKLNGSISSVRNLMQAIEQVRSYCSEIGCKFAAVFNGCQLVVFTAITFGRPWREGFCVVFSSLQDIKENFSHLWNMLAQSNVEKGSLISFLEKTKEDIQFKRVMSEIYNPDLCWARNDLYTFIQPISDLVFTELLDQKRTQILKECYVFDKTNHPLVFGIESFFNDKLPYFAEKYRIKDIIENENKAGVFQKEYRKIINDSTKGAIVLLVGGIGSGKSTFLHRFFQIIMSEHENLLWFYIDFRAAPIDEGGIEGFSFDRINNEWKHKYEERFSKLLNEVGFSEDPQDAKPYFTKLFNLLRFLKFSITVIIDNVDQHETSYQEKLFIFASHLGDMLKTVTIVALREETFVVSTRLGVFDAYSVPKFHIASPDFLQLVKKRIDFTLKLLSPDVYKGILPNISVDDVEALRKYFSIIRASLDLNNYQSKKIVRFIDSISVGNMRDALRMFNNFIVSGNTNIKEIFARHDQSKFGGYQLSYHQFVKSIMLGEHMFFIQDRSQILNVFDFDTNLTDSHFNLLRILQYLINKSNVASKIGRGYVLLNTLFVEAEHASLLREVIQESLKRLANYNLVEFDNLSRTDVEGASYVKVTPAGKYCLEKLIYEFVYLDLISIDTPIADKGLVQLIKLLLSDTDINIRLTRTKRFVEYLYQMEQKDFSLHPEYIGSELTNKYFAKYLHERYPYIERAIRKSSLKRNSVNDRTHSTITRNETLGTR